MIAKTGYKFLAIAGAFVFHRYTCSLVLSSKHLIGFPKYKSTAKGGRRPCKICKPTNKYNVEFSIPLNSKKVKGETVEDLKALCERNGYSYQLNEEFFYLETPKGKWKIHINTKPIRLEHINFLYSGKTYHRQPKLFLSYRDTFNYIKRHDER